MTYWRLHAIPLLACVLLISACTKTTEQAGTVSGGVGLVTPGKLTVCTSLPFEPFQFYDDGKVVGFDVDIVNLAAARMGVAQEIVDIDFSAIKSGAALNSGKCDLAAAGMSITEERMKNISFSMPYFEANQGVMAARNSGLTSLEDVRAKGLRLGVLASTTGLDYVKGQGFDPLQFADAPKVLLSLQTGQTDAIVIDLPVVLAWLKRPEISEKFELVSTLRTGEEYGLGMKLGNLALGTEINEAIEDAMKDGRYNAIYRKWFGIDPAPEP